MKKYSDKVEVYSFTDMEMALNNLETSKIDVFLVFKDQVLAWVDTNIGDFFSKSGGR